MINKLVMVLYIDDGFIIKTVHKKLISYYFNSHNSVIHIVV